ncbi:sulfotransferase family 2 domain-containing protein [Halorhodospira halochloris]|uniref:sulfotransferase family 2 domain-containing protein n=1 Tax=Halorhodospira halochloris TaxID=1052 RepID=UPI001EE850B3|nr:sulfotransferase family 2 domain-containing protein [Halorhodospira halochloris]MCG5548629.1 sulfotransferase family protein [Halorhodospira halochloris]
MASFDRLIAIEPRHNFTYIRIPKAGNSTITVCLDNVFHRHRNGQEPQNAKQARRAFCKPSSLSTAEAHQVWADHTIFTFVRNPYHRVLSAYLDKFCEGARSPKHFKRRYESSIRPHGDKGELSFTAFCRWLNREGLEYNTHWIPQVTILNTIGLERIDYIGRLERIATEIPHLVERIGGHTDHIALKQVGGPRATHSAKRCQDYYTEETQQIVRRVYHSDFVELGYSDENF